jgi:hypothetical protein
MTQDPDSHPASPPFEGPEKLLEIWFAPSAAEVPDASSAHNGKFGLRKIDRCVWEAMLSVVQCKVLNAIQGTEMDAYLLRYRHFKDNFDDNLLMCLQRIILVHITTPLNPQNLWNDPQSLGPSSHSRNCPHPSFPSDCLSLFLLPQVLHVSRAPARSPS